MSRFIEFSRENLEMLAGPKYRDRFKEKFVRAGERVVLGDDNHWRIADEAKVGKVDDAGWMELAHFHPTNPGQPVILVSGGSYSLEIKDGDTKERKETTRLVGKVIEGTGVILFDPEWRKER